MVEKAFVGELILKRFWQITNLQDFEEFHKLSGAKLVGFLGVADFAGFFDYAGFVDFLDPVDPVDFVDSADLFPFRIDHLWRLKVSNQKS